MATDKVAEVAVEVVVDQRGQQVLMAFVNVFNESTPKKATALSAEPGPWELIVEVKAKLLEVLPKYMFHLYTFR